MTPRAIRPTAAAGGMLALLALLACGSGDATAPGARSLAGHWRGDAGGISLRVTFGYSEHEATDPYFGQPYTEHVLAYNGHVADPVVTHADTLSGSFNANAPSDIRPIVLRLGGGTSGGVEYTLIYEGTPASSGRIRGWYERIRFPSGVPVTDSIALDLARDGG